MRIIPDERGATLVEALIAGALLVTLAAGTASLITLSRRLGVRAEQLMTATTLATTQLETLRASPWGYRVDGTADVVGPLDVTGVDTLLHDTAGFFEVTDSSGEAAAIATSAPAFTVRWAVGSTVAPVGDTRSLEICVFPWPTPDGLPPLVCIGSARARQP